MKDMIFLLLALFLTSSAKEDAPILDCDCLAQNVQTVQGTFTTDHVICIPKDVEPTIGQRSHDWQLPRN